MDKKRRFAIFSVIMLLMLAEHLCEYVLPLSLGNSINIDYRLLNVLIAFTQYMRAGLAYVLVFK
jgi:hypothetical protein